jgi:tetratricopeptide (TPR) repeat protein
MDKAAAIKNAQKFLAKGQIDKAIAEWEKISQAYPEGNTFNYIGDLYLKKGNNEGALETYHRAAKIYMEEGFSLKALAIYKKILNVNPSNTGALIALGGLSEEKSITTDAIKYYLSAADVLSKENKKGELLAVYAKITNLAPNNANLRVKIADMFSKQGFIQEAAKEYYHVGQMLLEKGDIENARIYLMKSMEILPNNRDTLTALSQLSEKAGDLDQATNYVKIAIERTGEDNNLLLRSAHLLIARGSMDEALSSISKVIEADPSNIDARKQLADIHEKSGDMTKAWQEYAAVIETLTDSGRAQEAIAILESYKDFNPEENGRKLVSLYKQAGNDESAVNELLSLHGMYMEKDMRAEAIACLKEALEIQPFNFEIREKIDESESAKASAPAPEVETPPEADVPEEVVIPPLSEEWSSMGLETETPAEETAQPKGEEKSVKELLDEAESFLKYGLYKDAKSTLESLKVKEPENVDVHLKLKTMYIETNDAEQAVTECIILHTLAARSGDEESGVSYLKDAYAINPDDPRLEGKITEEMKQEVLAEQETAAEPETEAQPESMEPPITELEEFAMPDLQAIDEQLDKETGLESDVLDIFDEFKKGLENEIEVEDAETHYNLGIAYKEMGLVDDSIKEFQISKSDPNYYVQSMTMLGICYMDKQLYALATESFSGALIQVTPGDESIWTIKYDLAEAYAKNDNPGEALKLYTEVFGWNARYRDVTERLSLLSRQAGAAGTPAVRSEPVANMEAQVEKEAAPVEKPKEKKSRVSYI